MEKSLRPISPEASKTLASLRTSLPAREFAAVWAWLSTFYAYQLDWLLDWSRFALLNKARQIGASHTYAAAAVLWAMLGETTTIISVGEREALEVLDKAAKHASVLHKLGSRWARAYKKGTELKFSSGGRVIALPASSGGRSYSGNVILDEFAYADAAKIWDGAAAVVMHGGRLRVMSTPNGVGNVWHALWTDPKQHRGYRLHQVTIDQARGDGLQVDEDECWKMARGDQRVFDQLFRCAFLDNEQQYIPSALISEALVDVVYAPFGDTYAGLDIGRTADLTALVVIRIFDNAAHVIHVETRSRTSQADIDALADLAVNGFRVQRLCVDATGMGAFPAEQLQLRHGRHTVEAVTFTPAAKEDMATTLYQAFASRQLKMARSEEGLRDDVQAIRRSITSAGNVRYTAPVTDKGHADRAWALGLALHAAARPGSTRFEIDGS